MKRLWTTFRYTFSSLRGQILGWGLGLALYGLMIVPMYDTLAGQAGPAPADDRQLPGRVPGLLWRGCRAA